MKVSLQTPNYCFETTFNSSEAAKAVVDALPFDSKVCVKKQCITFPTEIKVPCGQATDIIDAGNVVFFVKSADIAVFFSPVKQEPDDLVIIIGRTQIDPVAIGRIKNDDPIHAMSIQDDKKDQNKAVKLDPSSSRKLSQSEIDVLVQKLLAEKKAKEDKKDT